ncbi:putative hydroperoxide dehydratase [Helianthus annuus]|nr:putative hydroperoxide dehydratase [Helianthus annuus]
MATSSLAFPSLHHHRNLDTPIIFRHRRATGVHLIKATKDSIPPLSATSADTAATTTTTTTTAAATNLPLRPIPGSYGIPFYQPLKDRFEYFYGPGGRDEYFKSRVHKFQSTVFRANMPPGPFISNNPNVVVLLDAKSFPTLFDVSKVEKKDLFTGTYMPSTELTGGHRVLSYLDPSEPKHGPLKNMVFFMLKSSIRRVLPEFETTYNELFDGLESELAQKGKALFNDAGEQAAFRFLGRAYLETNPEETKIGKDGPKLISSWVLFNLGPLLRLGLPWFVEEPLLHTFRLPPALIKKNYNKLYEFFESFSSPIIKHAESLGISKEEAVHNILFTICFNTFGGIKILFPNTLKWIGRAGTNLHTQLAAEIRGAIKNHGGKVTMAAMEQMPLMKSVVYESLRIEPPVALQYGKAKRDMMIESHDAVFKVKEGEMLFGYQPFATKDPKVFDRPEEFVPDRFVGAGEELLKYVTWSNGPETEGPTVGNKQCAGKDFVVLITRLFVVELFRRYDSFDIEVAASPLGAKVTLTSLKRARM